MYRHVFINFLRFDSNDIQCSCGASVGRRYKIGRKVYNHFYRFSIVNIDKQLVDSEEHRCSYYLRVLHYLETLEERADGVGQPSDLERFAEIGNNEENPPCQPDVPPHLQEAEPPLPEVDDDQFDNFSFASNESPHYSPYDSRPSPGYRDSPDRYDPSPYYGVINSPGYSFSPRSPDYGPPEYHQEPTSTTDDNGQPIFETISFDDLVSP